MPYAVASLGFSSGTSSPSTLTFHQLPVEKTWTPALAKSSSSTTPDAVDWPGVPGVPVVPVVSGAPGFPELQPASHTPRAEMSSAAPILGMEPPPREERSAAVSIGCQSGRDGARRLRRAAQTPFNLVYEARP